MSFQQFKKIRFCDWEFYFYLDCAIVGQGFRVLRAVLLSCKGDAPAGAPKGMKTNEVCDRPLETFGAVTPMFLELFCYFGKRGSCGYPVDKHAHIA